MVGSFRMRSIYVCLLTENLLQSSKVIEINQRKLKLQETEKNIIYKWFIWEIIAGVFTLFFFFLSTFLLDRRCMIFDSIRLLDLE